MVQNGLKFIAVPLVTVSVSTLLLAVAIGNKSLTDIAPDIFIPPVINILNPYAVYVPELVYVNTVIPGAAGGVGTVIKTDPGVEVPPGPVAVYVNVSLP